MVRRTRGKNRNCALSVGACVGLRVSAGGTLPFLIQGVDETELFGLFMFFRIAQAPAQCDMDSSSVEQGANQRGRAATESSTSARADLWRDVLREVGAWSGDNLEKMSSRSLTQGFFTLSCRRHSNSFQQGRPMRLL